MGWLFPARSKGATTLSTTAIDVQHLYNPPTVEKAQPQTLHLNRWYCSYSDSLPNHCYDDENETTMRLAMEQPRHLLQFFITSSHLSLMKLLPQLTCFPRIFLPSLSFANQCLSIPCSFRSYSSLISSIEHLCE
ncbi:unnamed protein product [Lactuca saligna]|uniref:Uncharacterized protein n=1 Tax=Lactuca saligna TaxID=75948 RepID=A0AA35YG43_LACSI|nr:unnamed protein product [Lactuca saligna]